MSITTAVAPRKAHALVAPAALTGACFVAESVASVVVDAHVGYHSLNALLNVALLITVVLIARSGRAVVGRTGIVAGWATAFMAALAGVGGVWAVAVEGFSSAETPGLVEGITHTAVLASVLLMVPLGIAARHLDRVSGLVIAVSSACLVAMVLAGLDQPEMFLVPEAALGIGWLLLSRTSPVDDVR